MSKEDISPWQKVVTREIERLRKAAEITELELLAKEDERIHQEKPPRDAARHQARFAIELRAVRQITLFFLEHYLIHHLPSPREEIRGRLKWEVYLGALKIFLAKFPKSYFLSLVFPTFHLEKAGEKLLSFGNEFQAHLKAFYRVARDTSTFQHNFEYAEHWMERFREPENDLIETYAICKSWTRDEEFEEFQRSYEETCRAAVTIVIEGPLQLYLMISSESMVFIFRALTAENLSDLLKAEGVEDLVELGKYLEGVVKNSRFIPLAQSFMKVLAEEYLKDWNGEMKELRRRYPTADSRERFLKRFEEGSLFRA